MRLRRAAAVAGLLATLGACDRSSRPLPIRAVTTRPSILLITLDTTRADAIGPEATGVETPSFNAVAARGLRFRAGLLDGPGDPAVTLLDDDRPLSRRDTAVHENARYLPATLPVAAERLSRPAIARRRSSRRSPLSRRFGLARGFDVLRRDVRRRSIPERTAKETTDAVLAHLTPAGASQPLFLWVHYYDPHAPYTPPEPTGASTRAIRIAAKWWRVDEQIGRLVQAFERRAGGAAAIAIVGDPTARDSANPARRSTATCSIRPRCTCRSCLPDRA